jgi:hypothetical protein
MSPDELNQFANDLDAIWGIVATQKGVDKSEHERNPDPDLQRLERIFYLVDKLDHQVHQYRGAIDSIKSTLADTELRIQAGPEESVSESNDKSENLS